MSYMGRGSNHCPEWEGVAPIVLNGKGIGPIF